MSYRIRAACQEELKSYQTEKHHHVDEYLPSLVSDFHLDSSKIAVMSPFTQSWMMSDIVVLLLQPDVRRSGHAPEQRHENRWIFTYRLH